MVFFPEGHGHSRRWEVTLTVTNGEKKNCQTESKISAADKKGGRKLNPIMKKNYLSRMLWNTSKEIVSLFLFLNENAIGRSVKK